jgi:hypothetical protein
MNWLYHFNYNWNFWLMWFHKKHLNKFFIQTNISVLKKIFYWKIYFIWKMTRNMLEAFVSKSISYVYQNFRWSWRKIAPKIYPKKNILLLKAAPLVCFHPWYNQLTFYISMSTSSSLVIIWMLFRVYLQFEIYWYDILINIPFNHLFTILFFGFWITLFQVQFIKIPFNVNLVEAQIHAIQKIVFVTTIFDHCNVFSPINPNVQIVWIIPIQIHLWVIILFNNISCLTFTIAMLLLPFPNEE